MHTYLTDGNEVKGTLRLAIQGLIKVIAHSLIFEYLFVLLVAIEIKISLNLPRGRSRTAAFLLAWWT